MGYHVAAELPTELSKTSPPLKSGKSPTDCHGRRLYNVIKLVDKRGGQQKSSINGMPAIFNQPIDRPARWHGENSRSTLSMKKLRQGEDFATFKIPTQRPGSASNWRRFGLESVKVIWYQALKQWWKNVGKWLFCALSITIWLAYS